MDIEEVCLCKCPSKRKQTKEDMKVNSKTKSKEEQHVQRFDIGQIRIERTKLILLTPAVLGQGFEDDNNNDDD